MKTLGIAAASVTFLMLANVAQGAGLEFGASLSGAQEVTTPPGGVVTDTSGHFGIEFDEDLSAAEFELVVKDGMDITGAHLHCARAGVNGPIVVFLLDEVPTNNPICLEVEGKLTNADIVEEDFAADASCGVAINNIASLLAAILDGLIYVNVHSEANPAGEVRGQLLSGSNGDGDEGGHTHTYLTGRGKGHNKTEAETSLGEPRGEATCRSDALDHTHTYLTGRGEGHNETEAETSLGEAEGDPISRPDALDHTHKYLTGHGKGHNKKDADTSQPIER
jgi:hypothetical protein